MTTLGRSKSALLVIDVQNQVVEGAFNLERVIEQIGIAVAGARAAGVAVVWVQHSDDELNIGTHDWQIVPQLIPAVGEVHILKLYRSSFEETDLDEILAGLDVGHLFICGAQTNNCVRFTAEGALDAGYDVTLLGDSHTTTDYVFEGEPVSAEILVSDLNASFAVNQLPGRKAEVILVSEAFI